MGAVAIAAEMMVTSEIMFSVFVGSKCGGELFGRGGLRIILRSVRGRKGGTVEVQVSPFRGIFQNARRTLSQRLEFIVTRTDA